jgi:hypothetical protein
MPSKHEGLDVVLTTTPGVGDDGRNAMKIRDLFKVDIKEISNKQKGDATKSVEVKNPYMREPALCLRCQKCKFIGTA